MSSDLTVSSVFDAERRLQLLGLFRNKANVTETVEVPVKDDASEVEEVPTHTDIFATLADTHKLDPQTVRALAKDLLEKLTLDTHSPVPGSPVRAHSELPPAWLPSQL
jgi:hypothetical protein